MPLGKAKVIKTINTMLNKKSGGIRCNHCHSTENLIKNGGEVRNGTMYQGYLCRKCNTERIKRYRSKNRARIYQIVKKSSQKHKDRVNARQMLNYHIIYCGIVRPKICPKCKKHKKVEGHHDDYTKPLKVKWICRQCHADKHRELKNEQNLDSKNNR